MTQIRMINSDFIYKSKKICRISVICVSLYDRIGTQMTQIRLIYTDFIKNPKKNVASVLSVFRFMIELEHR
jgi:hypothetical protein